ncbi:hypothetical protein LRD18_02465 [Halorhodospira halochloris]|uniref:hypothetical protein n=1 Tax=Halorhodospira halochloris TaxID=1052 RepID=UPI001EE8CC01|nr:hypothetical protein [Halorhodospira halochloris]MCG5529738.1 hypothetical protein [Halorhodospira halochloris]
MRARKRACPVAAEERDRVAISNITERGRHPQPQPQSLNRPLLTCHRAVNVQSGDYLALAS